MTTTTRRSILASGAAGGVLAATGFSPILSEAVDHRAAMMAGIERQYGQTFYGNVGKLIIEVNRRLIFERSGLIDTANHAPLNGKHVLRRKLRSYAVLKHLDDVHPAFNQLDALVPKMADDIAEAHIQSVEGFLVRPHIPAAFCQLSHVLREPGAPWRLDFLTSFVTEPLQG